MVITPNNETYTIQNNSFEFELSEPSYEFGDAFEFDESPYFEEVFNGYNDFQMSDYVSSSEGVGFQKLQGGFQAIPNFETTLW